MKKSKGNTKQMQKEPTNVIFLCISYMPERLGRQARFSWVFLKIAASAPATREIRSVMPTNGRRILSEGAASG